MYQSTRRCPCERGCGPGAGIVRRSFAPSGDRGVGTTVGRAFKQARGLSAPGERCLSVAHGSENDAPREVTMFTSHMRAAHQPFLAVLRLRRSEGCARCRALWAPTGCALRWPLRRTEDVPCGTDVMTATYARAISSSSSFDPSARRPPSRKCLRRAARRRRQCPKARPSAGSKRSEEH